jgi:hypothetical protein
VRSRQRIVEIGGGSTAPSRVEATVRAPVPVHRQSFSSVGRGAVCHGIPGGNARQSILQGLRRMAVPNRPGAGTDQATDTSPRDKWRSQLPLVSTMRCRFHAPSDSTMRCRSAARMERCLTTWTPRLPPPWPVSTAWPTWQLPRKTSAASASCSSKGRWKKRIVNKVASGVVTFGATPPPAAL